MKKLGMKTRDLTNENYEKLVELFPNVVTEIIDDEGNLVRAIDKDLLMQEINTHVIEGRQERYQFTWPDKNKTIIASNAPTTNTLRPSREESLNFDTTENLYIEGDNLEVLKVLKETYLGKVKCIYIDPPYNTGKDFVYQDNFNQMTREYLENSGQVDDVQNRLFTNTESNGKYHSDWLNMMYSRIKLARNLLTEEGVLFISIDDNELDNLKKICDEIFGSNNKIEIITLVNNLKGRSDSEFFATSNEFLLCYSKNKNNANIKGIEIDEEEIDQEYEFQDNIGFYKLIGLRKTGKNWRRQDRPFMFYPIIEKDNIFSLIDKREIGLIYDPKTKSFDDNYIAKLTIKYEKLGYKVNWPKDTRDSFGRWRWGIKTFEKNKDTELAYNSSNSICSKMRPTFENGEIRTKLTKTFWYKPEYDTGSAGRVFKKIMNTNEDIFDNPKSKILIFDICKISTEPNDIVLDFFSGSATTAHAVMQLNAEDGGNRKFIMVQLPEATDEKSEAYKAGYKYITEIGKERIRRAGKKILEENKDKEGIENLDIGFRVLKLDSSNMKDIYYTPQDTQQSMLEDLTDNIKEDRSELDLLFQVMLDLGVELSSTIDEIEISGKKLFSVADNYLLATFDKDIDDEIITEIAKKRPVFFVMRDASLTSDSVATNFEQIFNTYSPETTRRVL